MHGKIEALKGISVSVDQGEIVTLIGANGAGKTTTLKTISGLRAVASGSIRFEGESIVGVAPHKLVSMGICQAPEGRGIFPGMTVVENLDMGAYGRPRSARSELEADMDRVFGLFPRLAERRGQAGGTLSGGEQQMLAIGRALMSEPRLLILDEPSTGLSPILTGQVFRSLEQLGREGMTILLLEQNVRNALAMCNRGYVLENGRIVQEGRSKELLHDPRIQKAYLGF